MDSLASLKPVIAALLLPPVPLILLMLTGTRLVALGAGKGGMVSHKQAGYALALLACLALWLFSTQGFSRTLMVHGLKPPMPMNQADFQRLEAEVRRQPKSVAILVLGGGREAMAPEYGSSDLQATSLERLRYGAWLARRTGAPLAFSGGVGWGQRDEGLSEARIAERVAQQDFGRPLRWVEGTSRDTQENATNSVRMLREAGVRHIVLVTHAWHMPRALRAFRDAAGGALLVEPAGMGYFVMRDNWLLDWLPSTEGLQQNRWALRELLALLVQR